MDGLGFVGEVAFVFLGSFARFDPDCSFEVVQLSCSAAAFVAGHDIYGVHPPIFVEKLPHPTLLEMKSEGIVMLMMNGRRSFLP